jgi:hypothetical protein
VGSISRAGLGLLGLALLGGLLGGCGGESLKETAAKNELRATEWDLQLLQTYGVLGVDTVAMADVLQHYQEAPERCDYRIFFEPNGRAVGYYFTYDTLNYVVNGQYELRAGGDSLFLRLDDYVWGTFSLAGEGGGQYRLRARRNRVPLLVEQDSSFADSTYRARMRVQKQ